MYNFKGFPKIGGISTGGFIKACFNRSKAFWCSESHLKSCSDLNFNNGEKAIVLPDRFEINLLRKLTCPRNLCNSCLVEGGCASKMASTFLLSTSIPFWWTKNPRKLPAETPNAHFKGFIFS